MATKHAARWRRLTVLTGLAGLIYNSWLLGPWLNPVAARGMASQLEAQHQPYNWLFVAGDIVCGLLVLTACWRLWRGWQPARRKLPAIALGNLAVFGLGTIVSALLPLNCDPAVRQCPTPHSLATWGHGAFSVLAGVCLAIGLALAWWRCRRDWRLDLLALAYAVFGVVTFIQLFIPNPPNAAQHIYLLLSGVWLALLPWVLQRGEHPGSLNVPPPEGDNRQRAEHH